MISELDQQSANLKFESNSAGRVDPNGFTGRIETTRPQGIFIVLQPFGLDTAGRFAAAYSTNELLLIV
jgi:hypothetical protein